MKSSFIATAVLAFAALGGAPAFANTNMSIYSEGGYVTPFTTSAVTRAQVKAEYFEALMAGKLPATNDIGFTPEKGVQSTLTRAEVQADAVQWVKAHHADHHVDLVN